MSARVSVCVCARKRACVRMCVCVDVRVCLRVLPCAGLQAYARASAWPNPPPRRARKGDAAPARTCAPAARAPSRAPAPPRTRHPRCNRRRRQRRTGVGVVAGGGGGGGGPSAARSRLACKRMQPLARAHALASGESMTPTRHSPDRRWRARVRANTPTHAHGRIERII